MLVLVLVLVLVLGMQLVLGMHNLDGISQKRLRA